MDSETLKVLLKSQEGAFKSAMDVVSEQLKSRITSLESTVSDLRTSLEFSQAEIVDLKNEVKNYDKINREKTAALDDCKKRILELQQQVNYQDDYMRRPNLRISGVPERNGETWEQTAELVTKLCEENLQLPPVSIERAHRVGKADSSTSRTIITRFEKFSDREAALRNARKLKGTGIYINEDLCPASQALKNSQLPRMKQARLEGKIAYFRHTRLIIKERTTQPPQNTGPTIPHGDSRRTDSSNTEASRLASMTTRSMTDGGRRDDNAVTGTSGVASGAAVDAASPAGAAVSGGSGESSKQPQRIQQQQQQRKKK